MTDNIYKNYLAENFDIDKSVLDYVEDCEVQLKEWFDEADQIMGIAQMRVLKAFQDNHVNDTHFGWNTGYGYDDAGRETVEKVFASVFHTEAALVRPNIVNGTHAISTALFGVLRPGDQLLYVTGSPYDTLETVIGKDWLRQKNAGKNPEKFTGTMLEYGILYDEVPLNEKLDIDIPAVLASLKPETKVVAFQRSTGYDWRPAISLSSIEKAASAVKEARPDIIIFADNCYGEFTEKQEPCEVGADIIAGSLIKNPGGGIAPTGGYIAGRHELIEKCAYRLTCPGVGREAGATLGHSRELYMGLFSAPHVVGEAMKTAVFASALFKDLGFAVTPEPEDKRGDIIQCVTLGTAEGLIAFCRGMQSGAPVDAFVTPEPWDMPGYDDKVIMAAGAFTMGASIELSADGPLRPPYAAWMQGGLNFHSAHAGVLLAAQKMLEVGEIKL